MSSNVVAKANVSSDPGFASASGKSAPFDGSLPRKLAGRASPLSRCLESVATAVVTAGPTMAAHLVGRGHAGFEFYSDLWIGPFEPSGTPYSPVEELATILKRAGLRVVPLQDARGAQWAKLVFNAALNPVGALTRLHHGAATRFPPTSDLYEGLLREGESGARAMGISLHGDPRQMVAEGANAPGKRNVSMLMDILATPANRSRVCERSDRGLGREVGSSSPIESCHLATHEGSGAFLDRSVVRCIIESRRRRCANSLAL